MSRRIDSWHPLLGRTRLGVMSAALVVAALVAPPASAFDDTQAEQDSKQEDKAKTDEAAKKQADAKKADPPGKTDEPAKADDAAAKKADAPPAPEPKLEVRVTPDAAPSSRGAPSPLAAAAAAARRRGAEKPKKFTTNDLEQKFGPSPAEPTSTATAPDGTAIDVQTWLDQRNVNEQERRQQVEAAQQEVAGLEARIKQLEQRRLAVSNPLLGKPRVDRKDEPENKDWDSLDARQRRDRTDKQLADARKQLAEARSKLARILSGAR